MGNDLVKGMQLITAIQGAATRRERRRVLKAARPSREEVERLVEEAKASRRRDPEAAARLARAALLVARAARAPTVAAEAAHVLGTAELLLGRPRAALRRQRAAARAAVPELQVGVAIETASSLAALGHESQARSALAEARRLARRAGPKRAVATAIIDLTEANLLLRLNRDAAALPLYESARRVFSRRRNSAAVFAIDANRATAFSNLNRFAEADRLYAGAIRHHRRTGQDALALQIEYNRAYLWFLKGRFHRAIDELLAARAGFAATSNERHMGLCDLDLAEIYLRMDLPAAAEERARNAALTLSKLGFSHDGARALLFLAAAERGLGRTSEAIATLETARSALRDVGAVGWEAVALHRLAELDAATSRLERAALRAADAAGRLFTLGFLERAGRASVLMARIALARGDVASALRTLSTLSERLRGIHAPWLRCELHAEWARALEVSGRIKAAVSHAVEAVEILERHRISVPADEHLLALQRQKAAIRALAVRLLLRVGGRREVARAYRLAFGGEVPEPAALAKGQNGSRARSLAAEAAALEAEIDGLLGRMPRVGEDGGAAARRAAMAAERERRLRECLRLLRALDRRPAQRASRSGRRAPGIAIVRYLAVEDETHAFVATTSDLTAQRIGASPQEIQGLVDRCRDVLRPGGGSSVEPTDAAAHDQVLSDAYRVLLAPLRARLGAPEWQVVPDDRLLPVPFQALLENGRPAAAGRPMSLGVGGLLGAEGNHGGAGGHSGSGSGKHSGSGKGRGTPRKRTPWIWVLDARPDPGIQEDVRSLRTLHPNARVHRGPVRSGADLSRFSDGAPWVHVLGSADAVSARAIKEWSARHGKRDRRGGANLPVRSHSLWVLSGTPAPGTTNAAVGVSEGGGSDVVNVLHRGGAQHVVTIDPGSSPAARITFARELFGGLAGHASPAGSPPVSLSPTVAFGRAIEAVRGLFPRPRDWAAARLFGAGRTRGRMA